MVEKSISKKQRFFVDMDGVLCEFQQEKTLEEISEPGYFAGLKPVKSLIEAVRLLISRPDVEVFILSHCLHSQAEYDKGLWLDAFLPEIDSKHRIFVPYGKEKKDFIPEKPFEDDILMDDLSRNLHNWYGTGIKVLNGINGTKKTWKGHVVTSQANPEIIEKAVYAIAVIERKGMYADL